MVGTKRTDYTQTEFASAAERLLQVLVDLVEELAGGHPQLVRSDQPLQGVIFSFSAA